ncbi:hypothetical protein CKF54_01355 [Psittacicella hinzii]|uniref:Uncharacterized protein n=1 Tax=Psittacicella hinzii TaxID=2028575 RepID=A0A3A1YA76_9GAMM|nr:TolC family protein [Psittacicella hinzii]RIY34110.1 hypothetical protein CKF54_01355 [Psittacicella hinzii]
MKILTSTALVVFAFTLSACTTSVNQKSSVEVPTQYQVANNLTTNQQNIAQWWLNWNDATLTSLIEQGLKNNLDLALAQARLEQAGAYSNYAKADQGPTVGVSASSTANRSKVEIPGLYDMPYTNRSFVYGGVSASWEVDIFGKKRSDAAAAYFQALASQDQLYATQVLITGQIAQSYFQLNAINQQQIVLQKQLAQLKRLEAYVNGRFRAGQVLASDLTQVKVQVSKLEATLALIPAQRDALMRSLAILTGNNYQTFSLALASDYSFALPAIPSSGQPVDLLNRRPDLKAKENLVEAAAAKVASAKADLYPRFNFSFFGMGGRINLGGDIGSATANAGMLGLDVQLPIFTNGRIKSNIASSNASLKAAMIEYDKNLLEALVEVENAYQLQLSLDNQVNYYKQAYNYAKTQDEQFLVLYKYGDKTLGDSINATIEKYNAELTLIDSNYQASLNMINLYKALGGGWSQN